MAGQTFDAVYSSPLRRALETSQIIAANAPILLDWRLAEIHHGNRQGKTKQGKEPLLVEPAGGESAVQVRLRVEEFLRSLAGKTILCISHGVVIQAIRSILRAIPCRDPTPRST